MMKKMTIKLISIALILSILIVMFSSCKFITDYFGDNGILNDDNDDSKRHTSGETNGNHSYHDFQIKSNEDGHYRECQCGEIKEIEGHTLDWVIDQEPTYTSNGYKHNECSVCGYKCAENTIINALEDPGVDPTPIMQKSFVNYQDLETFYKNNKEKINGNFLSIKAVSSTQDKIHIVNEWMELTKYFLKYDSETDNEFINPYVISTFQVYSADLGTVTDSNEDVPYLSFTVEFISYCCNSELNDLRFEFISGTNCEYTENRTVNIYDSNVLIGVVSLSSPLEITDDWYLDYLRKNVFYLK